MADDPHASPLEHEQEPQPQSQPRPGSQGSHPSASHYVVELPYPEELQAMLEGQYSVEAFLGRGGMGAVYRGLQLPLRRPVAIKILQKKHAGAEDDYDFEERFKREAYAMAALTHPHIVQVYDCGDAGEHFLFISMELVEGGDLSDAIKGGAITPDMALKLIPQICDGLEAAHERGIVHRDIKPANIFLTSDGRAKVADFGLAKKFDAKSTFMTKTGLGMGTPDYAAPEQYDGIADIDHRADIYSLGVMMYQMLTGKLPRGTTFKSPSQLVPVPPGVDAIVSRAMASEREERYQSVAEIKDELAQVAPRSTNTMAVPVAVAVDVTNAAPVATARPATSPRAATQTRPVAAAPAAVQRPTGRTAPTVARAVGKPPAPAPASANKTSKLLPIGIVATLAIVAGAWFMLRGGSKGTSEANAIVSETNVASDKGDAPSEGPRLKTTFPPGQWVRVLDSPEKLPTKMRAENKYAFRDGWMIPSGEATPSLGVFGAKGKNWGMRLEVKIMPGKASLPPASLFLRKAEGEGERYALLIPGKEKKWKIVRLQGKGPVGPEIASMPEIMPVKEGEIFKIEFAAIGNRLVGRVNGVLLPPGTDDELSYGTASVTLRQATRHVEFINLDGVPEAEALRLVGVDENGRDVRDTKSQQPAGAPLATANESKPSWTEVDLANLTAPDDGPRIRRMEDGLLRVQGTPLTFTKGSMSDAAVRAVVVLEDLTKALTLKMRGAKEGTCGVRMNAEYLVFFEQRQGSPNKELHRVTFSKPFEAGSEVTVELATIGTTMYAKVNGRLIAKAETQITRGNNAVAAARVKRLEFLKLDGVADPLGALGWDVSKVLPP